MEVKNFSELAISIFNDVISDYHVNNDVDQPIKNPFKENEISHTLYLKNWIDTVQWHLEDIIRKPDINPTEALQIKRRIDKSNQERTDLVELIDTYFLEKFSNVSVKSGATLNTETLAWAIDRLSILALKIYHMKQETLRTEVSAEHLANCNAKLSVLEEQQIDLSLAINQLLADIESGNKYMKTYKQMKMYNDPNLNPELYKK